MGERQVVIGVAVIRQGRVLAALRGGPDGGWEFPGGKVEPGETDSEAGVRELSEELGVQVALGEAVAPDVPINERYALRVYAADLLDGVPEALEHAELRWVDAAELLDLDWLPADRPFLPAVRKRLTGDT